MWESLQKWGDLAFVIRTQQHNHIRIGTQEICKQMFSNKKGLWLGAFFWNKGETACEHLQRKKSIKKIKNKTGDWTEPLYSSPEFLKQNIKGQKTKKIQNTDEPMEKFYGKQDW